MRLRNPLGTLTLLLLLTGVAADASGQDRPRSGTGRHRTEPPPAVEAAEATPEQDDLDTGAPARADWVLNFNLGMSGGSDLFRAETVDGLPGFWPGSTYQTTRVATSLDSGFALGLGLGRRVGPWVTLRGDLGWSEMDVTAESPAGQVGGTFTYDRFSVFEAVLGAETRLVRQPSAPYLGLGLTLRRITASSEDGLSQTGLGARLGLGYEQVLGPTWALRLEGRLSYAGFSTDGYVPSLPPQEVVVEGEDSLTIWQLLVGVQMDL